MFRAAASFAVSTGIRIGGLVAAVAIGGVVKAVMFLRRSFQPADYVEMMTRAGSPDRGFDHSFDGDEYRFVFLLIQSWPPFRTGPGIYKPFGCCGRNLQEIFPRPFLRISTIRQRSRCMAGLLPEEGGVVRCRSFRALQERVYRRGRPSDFSGARSETVRYTWEATERRTGNRVR